MHALPLVIVHTPSLITFGAFTPRDAFNYNGGGNSLLLFYGFLRFLILYRTLTFGEKPPRFRFLGFLGSFLGEFLARHTLFLACLSLSLLTKYLLTIFGVVMIPLLAIAGLDALAFLGFFYVLLLHTDALALTVLLCAVMEIFKYTIHSRTG